MTNPIVVRELIGVLRTRKACALQLAAAATYGLLVLLRWPTTAEVGLSGAQAQQVFRVLGYGLVAAVVLLTPAFPATSLVEERRQGTLALLFNSPMSAWSIYWGKFVGVLGFAAILLVLSLPAMGACYAMGGIAWTGDVLLLYAVLAAAAVEYSSLGLLVSSYAGSTDSALRITYGLVLVLAVVTLAPHLFVQGQPGLVAQAAEWLRCLSPIPAVMEILDQGDVASHGLTSGRGTPERFIVLSLAAAAAFSLRTITRLNYTLFDRPRPSGKITQDRALGQRLFRRMVYIVDPQRRKQGIGALVNPVMVKEFRSRRFGRSHWMLRVIAGCAVVSLLLTYATSLGTIGWGVRTIGGIMAILQVALIVLVAPSLAAGLISAERESGGWVLLQMTPLSAARIVRGKLLSVLWPVALILLATLPGYVVMMYIEPQLWNQISLVLITLALAAVFALLASAAISSLFRRTALATTSAYALLVALFGGTMRVWVGHDAPFGREVVERALVVNPMATALAIVGVDRFIEYELVPANWWLMGWLSAASLLVLTVQTWRLTRPQ